MALQSKELRPCEREGGEPCENKERYERITANVPSVVWEFDLRPDGSMVYLFLSDNLERLFGVSTAEVFEDANRLIRLIHFDDRAAAHQATLHSAETLEPLRLETRWVTKDRQVRWCRSEGTPVRLADGTVRWDGLLTDITESKEAEVALSRSEERLRLALEAAEMGVWHWDLTTGMVTRSPEAVRLWPGSGAELEGPLESIVEHVHPDDLAMGMARFEQALEDGDPLELEARVFNPDGTVGWSLIKGNVHCDPDGRAVGIVGTAQDVTDRKRADQDLRDTQARLRESEERYNLATHGANDGIWEWDNETDEIFCSTRFFEILGFDGLSDLRANRSDIQELVHEDDRPRLIQEFASFNTTRAPLDVECRLRIFDGTFRWYAIRGQAARSEEGTILRMAGSLRDIQERKQNEALRNRFIEGVLSATDDERRRIARELHDETGQALTSLLVGMRALEPDVPLGSAKDRLEALRGLTARTLDEIGRLARGLHPSVLDDLGFRAAVERYAAEYAESHGIPVDVHIRGIDSGNRLPLAVETTLYRILQEALTNIAKHAAADTASVVVERIDGRVRAIVEDDGCGFAADEEPSLTKVARGLGIHSIRERAALIRGSVAIESAPGQGTTIYVDIPVAT